MTRISVYNHYETLDLSWPEGHPWTITTVMPDHIAHWECEEELKQLPEFGNIYWDNESGQLWAYAPTLEEAKALAEALAEIAKRPPKVEWENEVIFDIRP